MNPVESCLPAKVHSNLLWRASVLEIRSDDTVLVAGEDDRLLPVLCDLLHTSEEAPLLLARGDSVLVFTTDRAARCGVLVGRIGASLAADVPREQYGEAPDEIVIEARKNLTLKCGEGSITLREDGKILVKGKDLVSRAQRMNRIKGGAVAIY